MEKSRYTEEQIIGILKQHEAGVKTADLCREHGISAATFYGWKSRFGGMDVSEAQRLKAMEDESRRLKLLVAELSQHGEALTAVIRKTAGACRSKRRGCVRHGRVPAKRTHGLQAAGCGAVELSVRTSAGRQRRTARGTGEAGAAEAALRLSQAACAAGTARP